MCSKQGITLALVFIWATFEYFMQFGPLAHMPYLWCLIFGVLFWSVAFWFIDVIGAQIQPKAVQKPIERPSRTPLQVFMSLVRMAFSLILLVLLIYLASRAYAPGRVSGFLLWELQVALSALALFWARRYLVRRCCAVKQADASDAVDPKQ